MTYRNVTRVVFKARGSHDLAGNVVPNFDVGGFQRRFARIVDVTDKDVAVKCEAWAASDDTRPSANFTDILGWQDVPEVLHLDQKRCESTASRPPDWVARGEPIPHDPMSPRSR